MVPTFCVTDGEVERVVNSVLFPTLDVIFELKCLRVEPGFDFSVTLLAGALTKD